MESGDPGKRLNYESEIARCLLYPRFNDLESAFAGEKCYTFNQESKSDKRSDYILSVGHTGLLKNIDGIHAYGCRTADKANQGIAERKAIKKADFVLERDGVCYIGCYILDIAELRAIKSDTYDIDVVAHPELGENAHYHLCLKLKDGVLAETKLQREELSDKRLDIIRQIFVISYGPLRHICPKDEERSEELSRIDVPNTRAIYLDKVPERSGPSLS